MAAPLALLSADWHVRKFDRVWYRRSELHGDTAWSIEQIAQIADTVNVPFVLLAGDLFEQKLQQSDALLVMRRALDRFESQDRRVLYVQGQHERSTPPLLTSFHSWPEHIDCSVVELEGSDFTIAGLDYYNPTNVEQALKSLPPADILLTHQVWRDFMGEERGDAWMHWVPEAYRMIATGDFHAMVDRTVGDCKVLSPGSICMQSIGEPAQKHVIIIYDDLSVTMTPLHTRGYYEERIHEDEHLEQFLDTWTTHRARQPQAGVPSEISRNILRVYYRADLTDVRPRIEAAVGADAHLFLKPIPVQQEATSVDVTQRQQAVLNGGLVGCLNTFYRDDPHVHEDAVRLARTDNVSDELLRVFKERMTNGFDRSRERPLPEAAAVAD